MYMCVCVQHTKFTEKKTTSIYRLVAGNSRWLLHYHPAARLLQARCRTRTTGGQHQSSRLARATAVVHKNNPYVFNVYVRVYIVYNITMCVYSYIYQLISRAFFDVAQGNTKKKKKNKEKGGCFWSTTWRIPIPYFGYRYLLYICTNNNNVDDDDTTDERDERNTRVV
jgi:hypothetical protein